ncbi:hypothetical protein I3760_07G177100 [Carya illinoinensis]|uniref:Uncharacterized protein n=1 Tax=Carya illinoinensis TaxID=32201 RepID=A0A922ELG7_CARIL|nr:hypothetical protein I3760_07G177100 [Carya illinoinensis]KAG6705509.1 hypothetical protein I3842_07G182200 [Carya illinoinensis]
MRLLTHNMLSSNINGVANGFPLCIEVEMVVEKKVEFKAGFLRNIFPKVKWKAFVDAAKTMGYPELPEEADSSLLDSDKFLTKFHHDQAPPRGGRTNLSPNMSPYSVNKSISNMLLVRMRSEI